MYGSSAEYNLPSSKRSSLPRTVFSYDPPVKLVPLRERAQGMKPEAIVQSVRDTYLGADQLAPLRHRMMDLHDYNQRILKNGKEREKPLITSVSTQMVEYQDPDEETIEKRTRYLPIQRIAWSTMDQDFDAWAEAYDLLAKSAGLSDEEFNQTVVPQLSKLLLEKSPLYKHMASGDIPVTKTHERLGKTPFLHTFDVLMNLDTSACVNERQRCFLRTKALFHDSGKAIIASQDFQQHHAAFSQSFFMEFAMKKWLMSPLEAYQFTFIERWHHASEITEKNVVEEIEIIHELDKSLQLMPDAQMIDSLEFMWAALIAINIADTASVEMWNHTETATVSGLEGMFLLFEHAKNAENEDVLKDAADVLIPWFEMWAQDGLDYVALQDLSDAELKKQIRQVYEIVREIVETIIQFAPQAIRELMEQFTDKVVDLMSPQPAS